MLSLVSEFSIVAIMMQTFFAEALRDGGALRGATVVLVVLVVCALLALLLLYVYARRRRDGAKKR